MATTTPKNLYRGAAATSSATLYTVPSATTTVVTNVIVTNTSASAQTFTLALDSVVMFPAVSIAAGTFLSFDMKQVLATTKVISGFASATTVNFQISGAEIA